ncbi:SMP-30/gluconolactonase/LRE family protein [Tropicimonas sp.]|uniref:SMP-30/gluconolactonase/LRE family protein n=1 Tax=Tropicimonas sp. TaxID=2067044 RepID=UPI003A870784
MSVFDTTRCELGEGPLWHPVRNQLFWFDIPGRRLLTQENGKTRQWNFDDPVTAAGWIDGARLLVASSRELFTFDLGAGLAEHVTFLDAENPTTRSNDGRADPWGGFWIGTMGFKSEPGAGAIYRYYRGELRKIVPGLTVPNAICFDPEGVFGCYADSRERAIRRIRLDDATGWPVGDSEIFIDMRQDDWSPDGAVMDAAGALWNAQWGRGRVAAYGRDGAFLREIAFPALKTTCPAFGGEDLTTLFCTTASEGLSDAELAAAPQSGMTFAVDGAGTGRAEHRVAM